MAFIPAVSCTWNSEGSDNTVTISGAWAQYGLRIKSALSAWRVPILVLALIGFAAGCAFSLQNLEISPSAIDRNALLAIVLLLIPASIAYGAINLMLMGHAAKVRIGFASAVKISVFSNVAEILPLPGGAIVRAAALIKAGSSKTHSGELVIAFSLLWICTAGAGAGLALIDLGWPAFAVLGASLAGALSICGWLTWRFGFMIAATAAALRILGVGLVAMRLMLAFLAIGVGVTWLNSAIFAFATILGSAASIVPAGLGISEGLSSLVAHPAGVLPAAAFLATALNRLLGLAVNIAVAAVYLLQERRPKPEPAHV